MCVRTTHVPYAVDEHKVKIPPVGQRSGVRRVSPVRQRSPMPVRHLGQRSGDTGTPDLPKPVMRDDTRRGRARSSLATRSLRGLRAPTGYSAPTNRCVTVRRCRNPAHGPAGNRGAKRSTPVQGERSEGLGGGERGREGSASGERCATSQGRPVHRLGVKGLAPLNNPPEAWRSRGANRPPTPAARQGARARDRAPYRAPCSAN